MVVSTRSISILGATGSIGRSTLNLIERDLDRYQVLAVTAHSDVDGLAAIARRVGACRAVIGDGARHAQLVEALSGSGIEAASGADALIDAAAMGADWTMAAIVGTAGLNPVMKAIEQGKTVALANKESLVSAGALMMQTAQRSGATLLPVDSEHNAVFQCFDHDAPKRVRKIILTASGGPFRTWTLDEMRGATPAQAVKHPKWSMGAKISIDSATLMNKGLELIEAFHLFPLEADAFEAIIHPQSIVHSLVEYIDGSVLAQLGTPDMRTPIAHTLAWPDRMVTPCERLDLAAIGTLEFAAPDPVRFPALALAQSVLRAGGARPAILNASNEIAVAAFLAGRIGFLDIVDGVQRVLDKYDPPSPESLDDVLAIDGEARSIAGEILEMVI